MWPNDNKTANKAPAADAWPLAAKPNSSVFDGHETLPERKKLSPEMQRIMERVDRDADLNTTYDNFVEGHAPASTDTNVRYAGYLARVRTILSSAHRYVAYTSDIGESFRPVAHPWIVRSAYGVSWLYILGDVGYEGYKAYLRNAQIRNPSLQLSDRQRKWLGADGQAAITTPTTAQAVATPRLTTVSPLDDYRTVMAQRAIFQSIASMGLPALTIHSIVKYSGKALRNMKNKTIRTWGPIGLGLSIVPMLPRIFDHPVETAVEYIFHTGFEAVGGKSYVGNSPVTGREDQLNREMLKEKKDL